MKAVSDFFARETDYPDFDGEGAVARLSQAIQCKTIKIPTINCQINITGAFKISSCS